MERSIQDPQWYEEANCATTDPEIMFPEKGGSTKMAKAICAMCLVTEDCLTDALLSKRQIGIAGGLAPKERKKLMKGA